MTRSPLSSSSKIFTTRKAGVEYDNSRFSSEEAQRRFEELKGQAFRKEKFYDFQGQHTTDGRYLQCDPVYSATCHTLGWDSYATYTLLDIYPDLVYEFNANLRDAYKGLVKLRNQMMVYTPSSVNDYYQLEYREYEEKERGYHTFEVIKDVLTLGREVQELPGGTITATNFSREVKF